MQIGDDGVDDDDSDDNDDVCNVMCGRFIHYMNAHTGVDVIGAWDQLPSFKYFFFNLIII